MPSLRRHLDAIDETMTILYNFDPNIDGHPVAAPIIDASGDILFGAKADVIELVNIGTVANPSYSGALRLYQTPLYLDTSIERFWYTWPGYNGAGAILPGSYVSSVYPSTGGSIVDAAGNTFVVTTTGGAYGFGAISELSGAIAPRPAGPNNLALSGGVTGAHNFIDTVNFVASYGDLINAFGTNQQAAQNWYNTYEPIENRVETFDGLDYVASYGDLINAFKSAGSEQAVLDAGATHYIDYGYHEGRTTAFNGLDYIASYGDLINAFGANGDAGAYHYIEHGASEGRTTTFDGLDYIASYGDLINAFGANEQAGAAHFIDYGFKEGRTTTFDGLDYIANYTDLMNAYGANNDAGATHYIDYGHSEGRSTSFDVGAYESAHPDLIGKFSSNDAFLTAYINTYKATGTFLT
jgi:hypothetical protein